MTKSGINNRWLTAAIFAGLFLCIGAGTTKADTLIYGANAYGLANITEINLTTAQDDWLDNLTVETQAIDRDPITGYVYYFERDIDANHFGYWDPVTKQNTTVRIYNPVPGIYPKAMAFSPDNTLYILTSIDELYTIDKLSGDLTLIGEVTGLEWTLEYNRTGDIAFAPDGTLYVATYQSLYELNLDTLSTTLLFSDLLPVADGFNVWSGVAYCDGLLYASNIRFNPTRSAMHSIDPVTGNVNRLFPLNTIVNDLSSCAASSLHNSPPELSAIGDKVATEGVELQFSVDAIDPDGDGLTFSVRNLPSGASFNPDTKTFSWIPGVLDSGDYTIEFVVTDNGIPARSDIEQITVRVTTTAFVQTMTLSGEVDTADSTIANNGYATDNFGRFNLAVGLTQSGETARSMLKWDLSSIPPGSVIVKAEMSMDAYNDASIREITVNVHRLLKPWVEGTLNIQNRQLDNPDSVCWVESGSGLNWEQAGASGISDRAPSILAVATNKGRDTFVWDLTSTVQYWIDGTWPNNGILLESLNEEDTNLKLFYSSEYQDENLRPKLIIDYITPVTNYPPLLYPIGTKTVDEQANLTFTVSASDPENGNLTLSADALPTGASFDPVTGVFNWTPDVGQAGSYTILFTVTDDGDPMLSDSEQITIAVDAPGTITTSLSGKDIMTDNVILNEQYTLFNFGESPNLYIGSSGNIKIRPLIKWDLSSIPPGSRIISAEMKLYSHENMFGNQITVNAHRMLRPWIEGTSWAVEEPGTSNWVEYGLGTAWEIAGADGAGDKSPEILATATNSGIGWSSFAITSAVQSWVDGVWENNGLILMSTDEIQSNIKVFTSSEGKEQNLIPVLDIKYTLP